MSALAGMKICFTSLPNSGTSRITLLRMAKALPLTKALKR